MEHFKEVAEKKSPIKMSNFIVGKKRPGLPVDVVIRKRTTLQRLTPDDVPFQHVETIRKAATIGSLKDLKPGQLLTITAMVSNLTATKEVVNKATQQKVLVRECQLTDPTGSSKLVLWDKFPDQVTDGSTYKFINLRLKSENAKLSLSTTQAGCTVTEAKPFPNLEAPEALPSTTKEERLEIFGVSHVGSYHTGQTAIKR